MAILTKQVQAFKRIPSGRKTGNRKPSLDNSQSQHCPLTCKTQWLWKPVRPSDLETASTSPAVSFEDKNFYLWLLGKQLCVWAAQWTPPQESKFQPNSCPLPKAMSSIRVSILKMRSSPHTSQDLSGRQDEMMHVKPIASSQAKDSPINTPQILRTHKQPEQPSEPHWQAQSFTVYIRTETDFMKHLIVFFPISLPASRQHPRTNMLSLINFPTSTKKILNQ